MAQHSVTSCILLWHCCIVGVFAREHDIEAANTEPTFDRFMVEHRRKYTYGSPEYEMRKALFEERLVELHRHNEQPDRLWTAGINDLTDRTEDELAQLRGWRGFAVPRRGSAMRAGAGDQTVSFLNMQRSTYRGSVWWGHLNATKSIRDQGECGSCWAIAAATMLDAHSEIHQPHMRRTFSTQEIVACVPNPHHCGGTGGCAGSTVELAVDYVMRHGLLNSHVAPYKATDTNCRGSLQLSDVTSQMPTDDVSIPGTHMADSSMLGSLFGLHGWARLPENKYEPLMHAVAERGPVAVSVAADTWMVYMKGIFDHCMKDAVIDHAVVLVGYDHDRELNKKFWIIQNSWGPDWGENGRIRLLRQDSDEVEQCGIDHQPDVGTGCDGGPARVQVCGMCGILYDSVVPYFA